MLLALVLSGLFIASFLLTGAVQRIALRGGMLDVPVSRSLHEKAKPVGGGIVIALLFLVYAGACFFRGDILLHEFLALVGGALVALVGLLDDLWKLSLAWRIPAQFAAASWVILWLGNVPPIDFYFFVLGESFLLNALAVLALVWLLNLYNFMDGVDGLAASELVFVNVLCFMIAIAVDDMALGLLSAGFGAVALGFLVWNWPPARIFMGDAGSNFIGFSLGVLALLSMAQGGMTVWTWLLLLGVFVSDATVTLVRRIARGDKWYEGHCCHAYQHAVGRLGGHRRVSLAVLALNVFWLAPLAWWTVMRPQWGLPLAVLGLAPLALLALRLGGGVPAADAEAGGVSADAQAGGVSAAERGR